MLWRHIIMCLRGCRTRHNTCSDVVYALMQIAHKWCCVCAAVCGYGMRTWLTWRAPEMPPCDDDNLFFECVYLCIGCVCCGCIFKRWFVPRRSCQGRLKTNKESCVLDPLMVFFTPILAGFWLFFLLLMYASRGLVSHVYIYIWLAQNDD